MSKMSSRQLWATFRPFRKKLTFCRKVHPGDNFGRLRHDFRPKSLAVVAVILVEWFYVTRESFAKISKNELHEDRDVLFSRIWRYFGVTKYLDILFRSGPHLDTWHNLIGGLKSGINGWKVREKTLLPLDFLWLMKGRRVFWAFHHSLFLGGFI